LWVTEGLDRFIFHARSMPKQTPPSRSSLQLRGAIF
ncbi:MAG: hypothetical protein RLZZ215_3032, partial [Pseudomonadota bacterium]|jgi:hypothetical protein